MDAVEFMDLVKRGEAIAGGTEAHALLVQYSNEALRITAELNGAYHEPAEVRALFSRLTGKEVDASFFMFPPFYTDFGKNISIGRNVFLNTGCTFQDRGGITVGDGTQIGQNVVLCTLNHGTAPDKRHITYPYPVVIGKNVWIGANGFRHSSTGGSPLQATHWMPACKDIQHYLGKYGANHEIPFESVGNARFSVCSSPGNQFGG